MKKEKNASKKKILSQLKEKLENWADKKSYPLEQKSKQMKERDKKVVCKSFHGAGIVVPVDANDVGYREVPETPGQSYKCKIIQFHSYEIQWKISSRRICIG